MHLYFQLFNSLTYTVDEIYMLDTAHGCIQNVIKSWSRMEMEMGGGWLVKHLTYWSLPAMLGLPLSLDHLVLPFPA